MTTETQINNPSPLPEYTPPPGVFGTKVPSSVTFAVAVLLFLLPFIEIKCNTMTLQTVSGLQLATGFRVKSNMENSFSNTFGENDNNKISKKTDKEEPSLYALIALLLGITGFILSMMNLKAGGIGGLITGVGSAISLVGLMIDVTGKLKLKVPTDTQDVQISVGFTPWFYITIICFFAAAFFSWKRMKANYK